MALEDIKGLHGLLQVVVNREIFLHSVEGHDFLVSGVMPCAAGGFDDLIRLRTSGGVLVNGGLFDLLLQVLFKPASISTALHLELDLLVFVVHYECDRVLLFLFLELREALEECVGLGRRGTKLLVLFCLRSGLLDVGAVHSGFGDLRELLMAGHQFEEFLLVLASSCGGGLAFLDFGIDALALVGLVGGTVALAEDGVRIE